MKLSELLDGIEVLRGVSDREIGNVTNDSRKVEKGDLFVCITGAASDGHDYAAAALQKGAAAVVCERDLGLENQVLVADTHGAYGKIAANFYGNPSKKFKLIGVTGTKGKTTVTSLIKAILTRTGQKVGLIGTIQNEIGDEVLHTENTTPDAMELERLYRKMVEAGCEYCVMEVSSHALMQKRVEGIRFRVGVFTNLTQDHLDYHGTMEAYCEAKARLFDQCDIACVNGDDKWTERLLARFAGESVTFGQDMTNDLVGWRARYENDGVRFTACTDLDHEETRIGIPGGFSLYNALAALCSVQALGVPHRREGPMRGRAAFCTVYRYHRLCPHTGRTEKYPFHRLRLCRRARDRTFWLRGRPRQIEASPYGTHCRGAFGLCRSHKR